MTHLSAIVRAPAFRFLVLSGTSFLLNVGLTIALTEWAGIPEELAFFLALALVFLTNFAALRYWVYAGSSRHLGAGAQLAAFAASSLAFRGAEYAAFLILHSWIGLPYAAVLVSILAGSSVAKFLFYRTTVFRSRRPIAANASGIPLKS